MEATVDNVFSRRIEVAPSLSIYLNSISSRGVFKIPAIMPCTTASYELQMDVIISFIYRHLKRIIYEEFYEYILVHYAGENDDIVHEIVPMQDLYFVTTSSGRETKMEAFIRSKNLKCQVKVLSYNSSLMEEIESLDSLEHNCKISVYECVKDDPKDDDYLLVTYWPHDERLVYTIVRYADTNHDQTFRNKKVFVYITVDGKEYLAVVLRKSSHYLDLKMALHHITKSVENFSPTTTEFEEFDTNHLRKYLYEERKLLQNKIDIIENDIRVIKKVTRKKKRHNKTGKKKGEEKTKDKEQIETNIEVPIPLRERLHLEIEPLCKVEEETNREREIGNDFDTKKDGNEKTNEEHKEASTPIREEILLEIDPLCNLEEEINREASDNLNTKKDVNEIMNEKQIQEVIEAPTLLRERMHLEIEPLCNLEEKTNREREISDDLNPKEDGNELIDEEQIQELLNPTLREEMDIEVEPLTNIEEETNREKEISDDLNLKNEGNEKINNEQIQELIHATLCEGMDIELEPLCNLEEGKNREREISDEFNSKKDENYKMDEEQSQELINVLLNEGIHLEIERLCKLEAETHQKREESDELNPKNDKNEKMDEEQLQQVIEAPTLEIEPLCNLQEETNREIEISDDLNPKNDGNEKTNEEQIQEVIEAPTLFREGMHLEIGPLCNLEEETKREREISDDLNPEDDGNEKNNEEQIQKVVEAEVEEGLKAVFNLDDVEMHLPGETCRETNRERKINSGLNTSKEEKERIIEEKIQEDAGVPMEHFEKTSLTAENICALEQKKEEKGKVAEQQINKSAEVPRKLCKETENMCNFEPEKDSCNLESEPIEEAVEAITLLCEPTDLEREERQKVKEDRRKATENNCNIS